jgi:hypothetical protein
MAEARFLTNDPLSETEKILRDEYYGAGDDARDEAESREAASPREAAAKRKKPKPTHYKVVCISLYTQDIENLEAKVAELKRRGHTKANKSQLIRYALRQLDLDKLPIPQP